MTKRYLNLALIYSVIAMAFGVFYREFTKFNGFTDKTALSIIHPHYFMLGMFFFLILALMEKSFKFSDSTTDTLLFSYQAGLNIAGICFLVRGVTQVLGMEMSRAMNASISGVAGIGHIFLGVSMVMLLLKIRKKAN